MANDLLFQSHGGCMRFFPVWNASALGAAAFSTLRAYGAFLVSGAIDATGVVAPVLIQSETGEDVVFETPWSQRAAPTVKDGAGATVPTKMITPGVFSFPTKASGTYTISDSGE